MSLEFPRWAAEEISKAKLEEAGTIKQVGRILEIDDRGRRVDVQFYDRLPEGRYIVTLELAESVTPSSLRMTTNYMFQVKVYKASLSDKLVQFLYGRYQVRMDSIHRYVLTGAEEMDIDAEGTDLKALEEEEE